MQKIFFYKLLKQLIKYYKFLLLHSFLVCKTLSYDYYISIEGDEMYDLLPQARHLTISTRCKLKHF